MHRGKGSPGVVGREIYDDGPYGERRTTYINH
jgi:hypothetical protein